MKTLVYALGLATLFAGASFAGDTPRSDAPHDAMRADKDGDGRVSRAEATSAGAERSAEWFDKLDLNKDGYITSEEMKQAREARHEHMRGEMKEKMEARFKEADANGDGQLSLDEVQAKMPRLADRFTTLDTDKNGQLSKDELKHGGPGHHPPQPQS
ncbi:MAG TPA: EF-hand domain-containing protein [Steroidobacteraceae bacterium]|jgi:Ca2+-binding EF-hand superfamily protein|nr:EF-hand domain-containing protein [Steroidobacteraceae bacterium]